MCQVMRVVGVPTRQKSSLHRPFCQCTGILGTFVGSKESPLKMAEKSLVLAEGEGLAAVALRRSPLTDTTARAKLRKGPRLGSS